MKIGINRWTFPNDWPIEKVFDTAHWAGCDGVEINMAEDGYLTPESGESEVRGLARKAEEAGVELVALSTGLGWKYPLTSPDAETRRRGTECVRATLRAAEWLGVDTVLVVPGIVTAEVAYDEAYSRAQEALRGLASEAEGRGVGIGVENVWNKFLLSPLEFARFLDEIGSPFVGAYFDAGNILAYGYPDQWIRILGGRIRRVHVKDFKANIGNSTGFCNPLQGDVPWERVRAALEAIGYTGYVTAEVEGYKVRPEIGVKHVHDALRAVFGNIDAVM